jgi:type VI secretion system protein VasD
LRNLFKHRLPCVGGLLLAASLLAAGCAKAPVVEPPPPPVSVLVEAVAAGDVNPDLEGRASPVIVRIYQLADEAAFAKAEFFPLWDSESATLATAVVGRNEIRLAPGARGEVRFKLDPKVGSVGVAAAYRDFRSISWRTSVAIPEQPEPGSTIRLLVSVDRGAVAAQWQ